MNIRSSNIKSAEHDGESLTVTFQSGRTYRYQDVKRPLYEAFMQARSKGHFLHRWIIGRKKTVEITPDRKSA